MRMEKKATRTMSPKGGMDEDNDEEMVDDNTEPPHKTKSSKSKLTTNGISSDHPPSSPSATSASASSLSIGTPLSLLKLLTPPLIALARPTTLSFPPPALPSVHPPTTSVLGAIHLRALECLNNLFVGMGGGEDVRGGGANAGGGEVDEEIVKGAVGVWDQMWSAGLLGAAGEPQTLIGAGTGPGQEKKIEMWNVASGVLWGLARMAKGLVVRLTQRIRISMPSLL